ncbi:hypothetical protein ACIGXM_04485 [Kitasatospora sp. NPDC052896]|uniref:hypothetical protein n=1 Tax=Kitasatospora sp. NPDC052896 TaxID=3364061 RepID=UPI0037C733F9
MYLVHACLRGPSGAELPTDAAALVRSCAHATDQLEHVVAHPRARPHPVLGLFVVADGLGQAEARAWAVCRRALAERAALAGWELVEAQVPLIAPLFERLLA